MRLENIADSRWKELVDAAWKASEAAYCPYSDFHVGAALLGENGAVYTGCNVENASYGPSNCAERTAVFKAVSEGCRSFSAIAVVGASGDKTKGEPSLFATPCGVCRQVLSEFCDPETFVVVVANREGGVRVYTLGELLPDAFTSSSSQTADMHRRQEGKR